MNKNEIFQGMNDELDEIRVVAQEIGEKLREIISREEMDEELIESLRSDFNEINGKKA